MDAIGCSTPGASPGRTNDMPRLHIEAGAYWTRLEQRTVYGPVEAGAAVVFEPPVAE